MRISPIAALFALLGTSVLAVEVPVSPSVYGPAPRNQYYAALASDGHQYLAVWVDERAETMQAYATRIAANGVVLDPNGLRVASGALTYYPSIIWSGSSWFVLSNRCDHVELVRVGTDGAVLDSEPRLLPIDAWCPGLPAASSGQHVALGYVTGLSSYDMNVLILNRDGESVRNIQLATGESELAAPAIAWDGTSFVAVWDGRAVRFDHNGVIGAVQSVLGGASAEGRTHIVADGAGFLITRGSLAFRMNADLVAVPAFSLPFSDVQFVHWTGSHYVVSGIVPFVAEGHVDRSRIKIVLLDRDGRILAERERQAAEGYFGNPLDGAAVATNGENVLLAWHDPTEATDVPWADDDTYAAVVSLPDLDIEPRKLLSASAARQFDVTTATSGRNQLTVWAEETGLYARRHWPDGNADGPPLQLSPKTTTSAAVAFNGSSFIVVSTEESALVARRVPSVGDLRVEHETRIDGGSNPRYVALAASGATTLVAWLDNHEYNHQGGSLYAARIDASGSFVEQPRIELATSELARTTKRIAISPNDKGEFLVVWGGTNPSCYCSPPFPAYSEELRAARVTSALTLLDPVPIDIAVPEITWSNRVNPTSASYDPEHTLFADHPSVTWNGSAWLVVWNRTYVDAIAAYREEIRGRRIARNGTLLDGSAPDPGVLIAKEAFAPTIAWTGSGYLLGWYEGSPNHRAGIDVYRYPLLRVRLSTFDRIGGPLSNERTLGEAKWADPISIAVMNGFVSLAYARIGDDRRYGGVSRAFIDVPRIASRRRASRS